jgi:hypothetical protein
VDLLRLINKIFSKEKFTRQYHVLGSKADTETRRIRD